ncbi:MAG: hypothetical protein IT167_23175 [Bryobacterales bacterium]|nr:hypothetical protein [Bryobacterales bacterium]
MNTQPVDFDYILDSLMLEESEPNYRALTRWIEQYPQFKQELSEFFAQWAIQAERLEEPEIDAERLSNLAVSHALDILHRREKNPQPTKRDTARTLLKAIAAVGISAEKMAANVRLDLKFVKKLDLRRLTELPGHLFEVLGEQLEAPAEAVRSMIAGGPPLRNAAAQFKAKQRPLPTTETFLDAVRNSTLSDEDKAYWIRIVENEKRSSK